jgi:hypothetical protein
MPREQISLSLIVPTVIAIDFTLRSGDFGDAASDIVVAGFA